MKTKDTIIIYGCGNIGEEFYFSQALQHSESKIVGCIDGNRTGDFHGIPITTLDEIPEEELQKHLVVVTTIFPYYEEIKLVLEKKGGNLEILFGGNVMRRK